MFDKPEYRIEIHSHGAPPLFVGHLVYALVFGRPDAVVCDQNIDGSETLNRCLHKVECSFEIVEIASDRCTSLGAAFRHQLVSFIFSSLIVENNFRASLNEHAHRSRTDST